MLRQVRDDGSAYAPLPFALEVIAFSDEEGTRFGKALLGSSAVSGAWDEAWWTLPDRDGVTLQHAFREFGPGPGRVAEAARRRAELGGHRGAPYAPGRGTGRRGRRGGRG